MEIKFAGKTYFLPDVCVSNNRQKAKLRKDLAEHGPESFLASHKLSPLAGCVTEELVAAGAEVLEADESAPGDESEGFPMDSGDAPLRMSNRVEPLQGAG